MEPDYEIKSKDPVVPPPNNRICPFISNPENLVECLRERCGTWMINECAFVRLAKGKQTF